MAKPKKIKRTKNIYKSRSTGKIVIKTIIFLFFLMALVFLGYIVSKEWSARVLKSQSSSDVLSELSSSTSDLEQSSDYSSEITSNQEVDAFVDIGDMNAKYIDSSTLLTMTYTDLELLAKQLKEEGYKAVCIELKDEKGNIYYSTENKLAREISAVVSENTLLNLLAPFKANNMFTIVSINTLKDAIAPHASRNNSYVYGNNPDITWWDDNMENGGKPWLNPYLQDTRQYIIDIVKEIANCKIDEKSFVDMIMLEGFEIPCKFTSKMNALQETAPTAYKNDVLGMLYKDLQMAAGNIPVTVSYSFDNTFSSANPPECKNVLQSNIENIALFIDYKTITDKRQNAIKSLGLDENSTVDDVVKAIIDVAIPENRNKFFLMFNNEDRERANKTISEYYKIIDTIIK